MFCGCYSNVRSFGNVHILTFAIWEMAGCVLGCILGCQSRTYFAGLFYYDLIVPGACFPKLLAYSVALLSSFLAIIIKCSFLLYMFTFLEGIAYAAVFAGIISCIPFCGWLIATMLLVPQVLIRVSLFYYRNYCLKLSIVSAAKQLLLNLVTVIPVLILEYKWINPVVSFLLDRL